MSMPGVPRKLRRTAVGCLAAVVAATLTGCSSSAAHPRSTSAPANAAAVAATRWWSNSAVHSGSTLARNHPDSALSKLRPSRKDYCGMLRQTVTAGKTVLPHGAASDPLLIESLSAFIGELQKVAPPAVAADWQLLGYAILPLVKAGGKAPKTSALDGPTVQKAASAVAADAKRSCGVDLSSLTG
jgi:hypothetical protein